MRVTRKSVRGLGDELADYQRWAPVKRQWRRTAGRYDGPKRKWEFNTMNSWGKRWADDDQVGVQHRELVG